MFESMSEFRSVLTGDSVIFLMSLDITEPKIKAVLRNVGKIVLDVC